MCLSPFSLIPASRLGGRRQVVVRRLLWAASILLAPARQLARSPSGSAAEQWAAARGSPPSWPAASSSATAHQPSERQAHRAYRPCRPPALLRRLLRRPLPRPMPQQGPGNLLWARSAIVGLETSTPLRLRLLGGFGLGHAGDPSNNRRGGIRFSVWVEHRQLPGSTFPVDRQRPDQELDRPKRDPDLSALTRGQKGELRTVSSSDRPAPVATDDPIWSARTEHGPDLVRPDGGIHAACCSTRKSPKVIRSDSGRPSGRSQTRVFSIATSGVRSTARTRLGRADPLLPSRHRPTASRGLRVDAPQAAPSARRTRCSCRSLGREPPSRAQAHQPQRSQHPRGWQLRRTRQQD